MRPVPGRGEIRRQGRLESEPEDTTHHPIPGEPTSPVGATVGNLMMSTLGGSARNTPRAGEPVISNTAASGRDRVSASIRFRQRLTWPIPNVSCV